MPLDQDRLTKAKPRRKRKAQVIVMPGVERRDLLGPLPSERLLQAAIDKGITDVCIVGRDRGGNLYVVTALDCADKALSLFYRAASFIASSFIDANK